MAFFLPVDVIKAGITGSTCEIFYDDSFVFRIRALLL